MEETQAIFIDRDGVVNHRLVGDYVKRWEEFAFLPDIFSVLPEIHREGRLAILITNQRGIGRRLMSIEDLEEIHGRMQGELEARTGHRFDAIYFCPHDRDEGCDCRKPRPGMLLSAARDYHLDLAGSWMIGDSESDVEAGLAAGCHAARVGGLGTLTKGEILAGNLAEAWDEIRRKLPRPVID